MQRRGQPGSETDGKHGEAVTDIQLEHPLRVAVVRDQLVGAGGRDLDLSAVHGGDPIALEDTPDASGLIRAAVRPRHILGLRCEQRLCAFLGPYRRYRLAFDAEQLLNRQFGLRVAALAEVVLEQPLVTVEEVARRPPDVLILLPDLVIDVDHDRVLDPESLHGDPHGLGVIGGLEAG